MSLIVFVVVRWQSCEVCITATRNDKKARVCSILYVLIGSVNGSLSRSEAAVFREGLSVDHAQRAEAYQSCALLCPFFVFLPEMNKINIRSDKCLREKLSIKLIKLLLGTIITRTHYSFKIK